MYIGIMNNRENTRRHTKPLPQIDVVDDEDDDDEEDDDEDDEEEEEIVLPDCTNNRPVTGVYIYIYIDRVFIVCFTRARWLTIDPNNLLQIHLLYLVTKDILVRVLKKSLAFWFLFYLILLLIVFSSSLPGGGNIL